MGGVSCGGSLDVCAELLALLHTSSEPLVCGRCLCPDRAVPCGCADSHICPGAFQTLAESLG